MFSLFVFRVHTTYKSGIIYMNEMGYMMVISFVTVFCVLRKIYLLPTIVLFSYYVKCVFDYSSRV